MSEIFGDAVNAAERAISDGIPLYRDALDRLFAHPDQMQSAGDKNRAYLAALLDAIGLHDEADRVLHQDVGSAGAAASGALLNAAGMLAAAHGRYQEALDIFMQALPAAAQSPSLLAKIHANLAVVSQQAELPEEAARWAAEAFRVLPEAGDPATEVLAASVQADIAAAEGNLPVLRQAAAVLAEASRARVAELGTQHPQALVTVANLATVDIALTQAEGSLEGVERCVGVLEIAAWRLAAELGAGHPQSVLALANLAAARLDLARMEASAVSTQQAVNLLQAASERISAVLGGSHPQARRLVQKLAAAREEQAREQLAEHTAGHTQNEPPLAHHITMSGIRAEDARKLLLAYQVQGYSGRGSEIAVRQRLAEVVMFAFRKAGVSSAAYELQEQGDGGLALLAVGAEVDELQLITALIAGLEKGLHEINEDLVAESRVRLRIALDEGIVQPAAHGYACPRSQASADCGTPQLSEKHWPTPAGILLSQYPTTSTGDFSHTNAPRGVPSSGRT